MINDEKEQGSVLQAEEWGTKLVKAREALSLKCDQVAQELNLPVSYIEKLEVGGLDGLPSMVFAKGYIRSYAKLVNLEDDMLVSEYEQIHGVVTTKGQIRPVGKEHQQVKMSHPAMKFTSWLIVLAIIGVSVWWWQMQYGGTTELPSFHDEVKTVEEPEAGAVIQLEDGSAQLQLPRLVDQPVVSSQEIASQVDTQESELQDSGLPPENLSEDQIKALQQDLDVGVEATAETVVSDEVAGMSVDDNVDLQSQVASISADFIAECWVSVKDADGKTLFNNLRGQGQSINVSGKPPLNILIGAADAVGRFSFNGEELDLAEHSRKNIIRINLPLEE
ncbi:MAG: RodZ domain-containing protein [Neptuniibacter sp.]